MSKHKPGRVLYLCGLFLAMLFIGTGAAVTKAVVPPDDSSAQSIQAPMPTVGMSDLMTQDYEFSGAFPAGWQALALNPANPSYYWATTAYTYAMGARSAQAVGQLPAGGAYTSSVDSLMIYGPVSLASVWQAHLDFQYRYSRPLSDPPAFFTVTVSTNNPISQTGVLTEVAVPAASAWTPFSLDLSPFAGQKTVYLAWRFRTTGGTAGDGPFVDDVHLRANYSLVLPYISRWMLTVSKTASDVALMGQPLVYTITVRNQDTVPATGVTLSDTLPVSTTFASADGSGVYDTVNRVVTWSDLTIPAGGSIVRHLTVNVPSSGFSAGSKIMNDRYAISIPPNAAMMYGSPVSSTPGINYLDDFSNPASGWLTGSYTPPGNMCYPPPGKWIAGYLPNGGGYGVNTICAWNGKLYPAPVRASDPANFVLDADMRSSQDSLWFSSYGLFFNASEDLHQTYLVRLFQGYQTPEWALYYWPNFQGSSDDQPAPQFLAYSTCPNCNGSDYAWNHIQVRRHGATFEIWMGTPGNLGYMGTFTDSRLVDNQHVRVGVHHGNFEWRGDSGGTTYSYVFDNFRLTPALP